MTCTKMRCSEKIDHCTDSLTLSLAEKAAGYTAAGESVIRFGTGEPDFQTPKYICDGAKAAIDAGYTKYDAVAGVYALRQAICNKLKKENGLSYTPDEIIVGSGAKSSLSVTLQALLDPGDEVIMPRPYWVSYTEMVKLAGGRPVIVDTRPDNHFKMTAAELQTAVTSNSKVVMLNTPVNPTGQFYTQKELQALATVIVKENLIVISDEIYEAFMYDGNHAVSIAALGDAIKAHTVVVNGFSKTFAMTGWRLGYAAAPQWIIDGMKKIQGHTISHPSTITQHAGVTALKEQGETIRPMIAMYDGRRRTMMKRLDAIPELKYLYPAGTFYIFVDVRDILADPDYGVKSAYDLSMQMLESKKVVTIPGEAFGVEGFLRFAYTVNEKVIEEGFDRIEAFLSEKKSYNNKEKTNQ